MKIPERLKNRMKYGFYGEYEGLFIRCGSFYPSVSNLTATPYIYERY